MKKYLTYKKLDVRSQVNLIADALRDVSEGLVMIAQQFDKERNNLDSEDVQKYYRKLQTAVEYLNEFYKTPQLPFFENAKKDLEKIMKEDIY